MPFTSLVPPLPQTAGSMQRWRGLPGSAAALAVASAAQRHAGPVLAVAVNEQHAYRLEEELRFFAPADLPVLHFPDTEVLPYDAFSPHQEILSARLAALYRLPRLARGVVVVSTDALIQRLPPPGWLDGRAFLMTRGERLDVQPFRERLVAAGYQPVSEVQTQGEFAVRGAVVDVFPMGSERAFRLDLFDEEIETIRVFDPETQRSTHKVEDIRLLPAREFPTDAAGIETFRAHYRAYFPGDPARSRIYSQVSKRLMPGGIESYLPLFFEHTSGFTDYLPANALVIELGDLRAALDSDWQQIEDRFERLRGDIERPLLRPDDLFRAPAEACERLAGFARVQIGDDGDDLGAQPFGGGADAVKAHIEHDAGRTPDVRTLFVAESPGRREALLGWLAPLGVTPRKHQSWVEFVADGRRFGLVLGPIQDGFALPEGIHVIAETQVFGARPPTQRRRKTIRDPETILRDLSELAPGSPVVHVDHGVGRYRGLTKLDAGGVTAEYLVLEYAGGDKLYVPVAALHQVHRYTGAEAEAAPLHALGSDRWEKARERARKRAHDVAAELLSIQARRASRPGMRLAVNDADYQRFCDAFPFAPTPDQQKTIDGVLADMAADRPMDRVVCGDVGFGKTEVAMRAAFVAAINGRQVCVLAPTTLLAQQHHKNFCDRFAGWPVKIGVASRLRAGSELKALLDDAAAGRVDIVIGTHRLLQDDVRFRNLGLLIIDEEHRFGVRHKERIKNLRAEVDVLTLTATPIPRTLNMALAGLRELSLIATPPEGRLSIRTFVAERDRGLIQEACLRELRRGGQIYYLHNEVRDIERTAAELREWVPEAGVRVAHGQMRARELEQTMLDFYHQRFNLLVCSTIIESGIDIPTANTIVIDRADKLGLAQLHQLRGRVGRSHHRAYAYLLVPDKRALTGDAAKRLEAVEAMGELGSGFMLATHDLEIRGAGELLGAEQSGQIEEVGFTLYAELLARAVSAIKSGRMDDRPFCAAACEVDLGVTALIPDDYVPDVHTRLSLYQRAAEAADEHALDALAEEMADRFGALPEPARHLLAAARLRLAAERLGIVKVRAGARGATLEFAAQPQLDAAALIRLIQSQPQRYRLEGGKRLHWFEPLAEAGSRAPRVAELFAKLARDSRLETA